MHRISLTAAARRRLSWIFFVVAGVLVMGARGAAAADPKVEKEAQALQKKAIEEDNLNVNYSGAVKKLQSAIAKCDGDKCSSAIKASLLRDLGAMQILNGGVDDGKASFGQAIGMEASIELDPAYKNPQLEGIWAEVKKKGGGPAAPVKAGPEPTGDFTHTPPTEALVRTPLPVYVEYAGSEELTRVTVKYKGFGQPDWKTIELKKTDSGFGALIPCKDATQGLMQYYVQGFNGQNDPVATSGTRSKPFTVPVNQQITGPNPSLPGEEPPAQCADTGECPPGFPGCGGKKKASGEDCAKDDDCDSNSCTDDKCADKKAAGDDCQKDDECNSGSCSSGKCAGKKAEGEDCEADEDCDSDRCKEGKCSASASSSKAPKVWLGLSVQADWYALPGQSDACIVNSASSNPYACVDPSSGNAFPQSGLKSQTLGGMSFPTLSPLALNNDIATGVGDQVVGGFKLANFRIMVSLDYALGKNVLLGLRGGYVFNTDPTSSAFAPLHLEGRLTYLFGKDAVAKKGISPMLFAGLGAGEFDAFVPVDVTLKDGRGPATENAWITAGPVFFSVGGGARLLLSTKVAATAALKFEGAFGGSAGFLPGVAPELGIQFGL